MTKLNLKNGQMLIIGILFLAILLIFSTTIFTKVKYFINFGANATYREQARHVAEAGIDYATREINNTPAPGYTGTPPGTFVDVGSAGNFEVQVDSASSNLKTITVTGYAPKTPGHKAKTKIRIDFKPGEGVNVESMGAIRDSAIVENNGYIYSIGGTRAGCWLEPYEAPSNVQFAKIIDDGGPNNGYLETSGGPPPTIGYTSSLPEPRRAPGAVAADGYIYVIAGVGQGCGLYVSTVYYTQPNPVDGTIANTSDWITDVNPTPVAGPVEYSFVYNNHVYIIQGHDISYAPILPAGGLGAWTTQSGITPDEAASYVFDENDGYIYHISGHMGGPDSRDVWYAKVNTGPVDYSVENFIEITDVLPTRTTLSAATISTDDYIYVMGGRKEIITSSGTFAYPPAKTVYYQKIKSDHTLDPFLTSPKNLPNPRWADFVFGSITRNDKIFLFGGLEDPGNGSSGGNIWVADIIGPNGEIDNWTDNGGTVTYTGWALDKATYKYK